MQVAFRSALADDVAALKTAVQQYREQVARLQCQKQLLLNQVRPRVHAACPPLLWHSFGSPRLGQDSLNLILRSLRRAYSAEWRPSPKPFQAPICPGYRRTLWRDTNTLRVHPPLYPMSTHAYNLCFYPCRC